MSGPKRTGAPAAVEDGKDARQESLPQGLSPRLLTGGPPLLLSPDGALEVAAYRDVPRSGPWTPLVGRRASDLQALVDAEPRPRLAREWNPCPSNSTRFEATGTPLQATSFGRPLEKLSWCPRTGELLFVHPPQQHRSARGSHPFEDYVRLILLREHGRVCARPCLPSWLASSERERTRAWTMSTALQLQAWRVLVRGKGNWHFELNVTNARLRERTGRGGW